MIEVINSLFFIAIVYHSIIVKSIAVLPYYFRVRHRIHFYNLFLDCTNALVSSYGLLVRIYSNTVLNSYVLSKSGDLTFNHGSPHL